MTTVLKVFENITIAKNPPVHLKNPEKLKISILPPEVISPTKNFTSNINSNKISRIDAYSVKNNSILTKSSGRVISEDKYRIPEYLSIASLNWRNISSVKNSSHSASNKKEIILSEKHLNRNRKKSRKKYPGNLENKGEVEINKVPIQKYPEPIHLIQRDNITFRTKKLSKCSHYHRKLKQRKEVSKLSKGIIHLYGYDRPSSSEDLLKSLKSSPDSGKVSKFGMKDVKQSAKEQHETIDNKSCQFLLPATTTHNILSQYVYFSITVIEGKSKRYNLLNRAVATCDITLTGANMPYGFTEKIKVSDILYDCERYCLLLKDFGLKMNLDQPFRCHQIWIIEQ